MAPFLYPFFGNVFGPFGRSTCSENDESRNYSVLPSETHDAELTILWWQAGEKKRGLFTEAAGRVAGLDVDAHASDLSHEGMDPDDL